MERNSQLERYCGMVSHLRLLTILLIEKVEEWRKSIVKLQLRATSNNQLQSVEINPVVFYFQDKNVLEMILRDTVFLNTSILRKYIQFSKGYDPLLLYPYRQLLTNSSTRMRNYDAVLRLFELGREMNTRIQQAEVILKE
jgi:hypothetical protein